MSIPFYKFEIPVLEAIDTRNGEAKIDFVYNWIRKNKKEFFEEDPELLGRYKEGKGQIIWQNKIRFAREYMKRKGQLEFPSRGVWKITAIGKDRLENWRKTGSDPDQGLEIFHGITEVEETQDPEKADLKVPPIYEHGDLLGFKGIVYEPINEQGVILLFAAMAEDLGFMIESIRSTFPDALLKRKNSKNRWQPVRAEFEFKASTFIQHGHNQNDCDLIICWENDLNNNKIKIPILSLEDEVDKIRRRAG